MSLFPPECSLHILRGIVASRRFLELNATRNVQPVVSTPPTAARPRVLSIVAVEYLLPPGLGNDENIARQHIGIGTDIRTVDEIIDSHPKLLPVTINYPHDT